MISLVLCIVLSSLLFTGFKWFDTRKINLQMAITGNYISCIITGLILNSLDKAGAMEHKAFPPHMIAICLALGTLFFAVFYAMGYSSAKVGVGITSASTKMSLVIPVLYGTIALGEEFNTPQVLALILALVAVFLMSWNKEGKTEPKQFLLPFLIFIGSGIVDTAINLLRIQVEKKYLDNETSIILIFSGALCSSLIILLAKNRHLFRDTRSLAYGLLLGIPNYLSIYFMMKALGSGDFPSNTFYMVNNTGTMMLCFMLGLLLFTEKITWIRALGILLSVLAIYLILFPDAVF